MTSKTRLGGKQVYIVDGSRTPFLKAAGVPGPFRASDLAVNCSRPLMARQPFVETAVDQVVVGCVSSGPDEANIARVIALRLGCGDQVPAWTVQRNCASGMQAVVCAAKDIAAGRSQLILAGGTESMSHHPLVLKEQMVTWLGRWYQAKSFGAKARHITQLKLAWLQPVIALLRGLTDPVVGLSMGQTAEELAWHFKVSREEMDAYALRSHQRLAAGMDAGHLHEVEPLYDSKGHVYSEDGGLRRESSLQKLAKLRPVFDKPVGSVTAGNSAQVTDGAAMLLLASHDAVRQYKLQPLGRITDFQWAALDPSQMGLGPVHAMAPILQRHALNSDDIDYWEVNEAFAAQILACCKAWTDTDYCRKNLSLEHAFQAIPADKLNVDGGGISMGHPVGASGARIILHLLHTLKRNQGKRGIASLCVGGGQGGAVLLETE
ncbi:MAG: acetyl-CoA C-acetyltransferase [gamma proteobacterium symbiont of Bathyaustriella thionipta]|nr:acetyl-CoA C-acetyltransferase [gamma proteobacterium symbiont of Bathyaustriella thionipta]